MVIRRLLVSAFILAVLSLALVSPTGAASADNKTMLLTFSQPVRLPGVVLGSGRYIFEARTSDVVQVLSGDRSRVYFMGFTRTIDKPRGLTRHQVVSLGEAAAGAPIPIKAWYPDNESTGRQFIYPESR